MQIAVLDEAYRGEFQHFRQQVRGSNVVALKLDGFHHARSAIRRRMGSRVSHHACPVGDWPKFISDTAADVFVCVPDWRYGASYMAEVMAEARLAIDALAEPRPRLVLFDTFDQTSSPYFDTLPSLDLFVKSQLYRDPTDYQRSFAGGYMVSDWAQRELGFDLQGWQFGSRPDGAQISKVVCGWNFGVSRFYLWLGHYARLFARSWKKRSIDINSRFAAPVRTAGVKWEWYQEYRGYCRDALRRLEGLGQSTGFERLDKTSYLRELADSRIVFSPFGWGEICFRDYEAVACGALLLKPSVEHLVTSPDIFVPGKTYVPVRWDLSDLPELCSHYLAHPEQAEAIARAAQERLLGYLRRREFAQDAERALGAGAD